MIIKWRIDGIHIWHEVQTIGDILDPINLCAIVSGYVIPVDWSRLEKIDKKVYDDVSRKMREIFKEKELESVNVGKGREIISRTYSD